MTPDRRFVRLDLTERATAIDQFEKRDLFDVNGNKADGKGNKITLQSPILKENVQSGTGVSAQIPGVTVAGKTGTAQHGLTSQHLAPDAWFVSFAPAEHR